MAQPQKINGSNVLGLFRLEKNAATEKAAIINYQTSLDFEFKRDSDSTSTKTGSLSTSGSLETTIKFSFVDNISKVSDDIRTSILNAEPAELWQVQLDRKNSEGKYFGCYVRGTVSSDSAKNDDGDNSTRECEFKCDRAPQYGWTDLDATIKEALSYAYQGIGVISDSDKQGGGKAYNTITDRGLGSATGK